ncbi:NAD-dependent epimerase/dehydratase family protein [Amycolatopsis sp. NPDC049868]|uniref:NAD-dependent epimerase/dehydratase family protein n=1 Tax=Amycolatopsis sp. NPDC049868 TaxID=3363934 RepID=UPI00378B5F74
MPSALVTGGLGFLGSHLVEELVSRGIDTTVVDSKICPVVSEDTLPARVVVVDAADYDGEGRQFDYIFHLADLAGPAGILPYAGQIAERTINGLTNVMRLAVPGKTRMLFVSSSEIYGKAGCYPESEPALIYTPYTVRLEYAAAKSLAEITLLNHSARAGLHANVIRPFNIAGPRQSSRGGFVIPRFFEAALTGQPLTVFGDGSQIRTFTHVEDTVGSILAATLTDQSGEIFNSGNPGNKVSILDLAEQVRALCGSSSPIELVDPRDLFGASYAESFDKVPDVRKIGDRLGWQAKRSLGDLLDDVHASYTAAREEAG